MSVNAAGSASNVQQALVALRQTVQAEQVAAVVVTEAANQAAQNAQQDPSRDAHKDAPASNGRGGVVDVKA
ncbi:hypothetical protein [Magnetovibrio blakemorei]|uniref:hypothetical protein n=1 Tax=Magnetovibrio blakemorei TaxID=28181 RepID=UPI001112D666|nr:hypothetical protein [Magnetovibrio blakemorei]